MFLNFSLPASGGFRNFPGPAADRQLLVYPFLGTGPLGLNHFRLDGRVRIPDFGHKSSRFIGRSLHRNGQLLPNIRQIFDHPVGQEGREVPGIHDLGHSVIDPHPIFQELQPVRSNKVLGVQVSQGNIPESVRELVLA